MMDERSALIWRAIRDGDVNSLRFLGVGDGHSADIQHDAIIRVIHLLVAAGWRPPGWPADTTDTEGESDA